MQPGDTRHLLQASCHHRVGVSARATLALLALLGPFGCAGTQKPGEPSQLRVVAQPGTAVVYVDERFVAAARKLSEHPVSLRPGTRRVTIRADEYFPHDLEVELTPGVTTIEVSLRPVPP